MYSPFAARHTAYMIFLSSSWHSDRTGSYVQPPNHETWSEALLFQVSAKMGRFERSREFQKACGGELTRINRVRVDRGPKREW